MSLSILWARGISDVRMAILGFEQSTLMAELSCSKTIIWPVDILTSTTALSADGESLKRQPLIRFLCKKFLKICITLMADL